MSEVKQPELRASDKDGNVRPADDRFLSSKDKKKRDAYVDKVEAEAAKAAEADAPAEDDPFAEVIDNAVQDALTRPEPAPVQTQEELPNV